MAIISVSRRTDIPAFYSDWFFEKLENHSITIKNPYNGYEKTVSLKPDDVDCFVFWTKNAKPMLNKLDKLKEYNFYFQHTITPYNNSIETNVPPKAEVIETFKTLSDKIGKEKTIWRYDPILLTDIYTKEVHYKYFEIFCRELSGYTEKCIISFIDLYGKVINNTSGLGIKSFTQQDYEDIAREFSKTAQKYNIQIETCAEFVDLDKYNIKHGHCIDSKLIERLIGRPLNVGKDQGQRKICGCATSIDIGAYNTCKNGCKYCYATTNHNNIKSM